MAKLVLSLGGGSFSLALAVILAKAQTLPEIWYRPILTSPHVVPSLLIFSACCFVIALGQWGPVGNFYWRMFSRMFPDPHQYGNSTTVAKSLEQYGAPFYIEDTGIVLESAVFGVAASSTTNKNSVAVKDKVLSRIKAGQPIPVSWQFFFSSNRAEDDLWPYATKFLTLTFSITKRESSFITALIEPAADDSNRKQIAEPELSRTELLMVNRASTDFMGLTYAQQTALCVVYQQPNLRFSELMNALEGMGFRDVNELIVEPLNKTTLVTVDLHNVRIGPSVQPVVSLKVQQLVSSLKRL